MFAYRTKKKVSAQGGIQLEALPFAAGEVVEVIILAISAQDIEADVADKTSDAYFSLKGSVLTYLDPTEPVAQDDWLTLQ